MAIYMVWYGMVAFLIIWYFALYLVVNQIYGPKPYNMVQNHIYGCIFGLGEYSQQQISVRLRFLSWLYSFLADSYLIQAIFSAEFSSSEYGSEPIYMVCNQIFGIWPNIWYMAEYMVYGHIFGKKSYHIYGYGRTTKKSGTVDLCLGVNSCVNSGANSGRNWIDTLASTARAVQGSVALSYRVKG